MTDDLLSLHAPRPSRADAIKNRQSLLQVARELCQAQGVDAVTMSAIAEGAGVGKGTLYRHFNNKAEVIQALLDADQRALQERTLERLRSGGLPDDNLRWFLLEVLHFVWENAALLQEDADAMRFLHHPAHAWWRQTLLGLLGRCQVNGECDYLADVLYMLVNVPTVQYQKRMGYSLEKLEAGLLTLLNSLLLGEK